MQVFALGVVYSRGPISCMAGINMIEWLKDPSIIIPLEEKQSRAGKLKTAAVTIKKRDNRRSRAHLYNYSLLSCNHDWSDTAV